MKVSIVAGLAASTLVLGMALTGCGKDEQKSSPSSSAASSTSASAASSSAASTSSSAAAQPGDYGRLLIKPEDIVVPGDTFTVMQTLPVPNPAGIEGVFVNQSNNRKVDDTIYVYPD